MARWFTVSKFLDYIFNGHRIDEMESSQENDSKDEFDEGGVRNWRWQT